MERTVAQFDSSGIPTVHDRYALRRIGVVMRPLPGEEMEALGVLNPGGVRGKDGAYYLFPRIVAPGNFSRIGLARVIFDADGLPTDVDRLGIALEPTESYERNTLTGGGCEDPRVIYFPALGVYLMTYVAYGPRGPRAALARSTDLIEWTRLGLIDFAPMNGADMNRYGNKDALIFPEVVPGPDGRPSLALIHRPMYESWEDGDHVTAKLLPPPPGIEERRWSMWISFCPLDDAEWAGRDGATRARPCFSQHSVLLTPGDTWESVRIGGGTPPVRLDGEWFTIYHGIGVITKRDHRQGLEYSAGGLLLASEDPRKILYRSPEPILAPAMEEERAGTVSDVVFPTAVDLQPTHMDVYYGMADASIGVARMDLQSHG